MKRTMYLSIAQLLLLFATSAQAQMPREISYQGMLLGADEQPVPKGNYRLTFKLYDEPGNMLWSEIQDPVFIAGGLFHVFLGSVSPLNLPFDQPYFLGIQIGNDPELQPRMYLAPVPYSIRADDANKVAGIRVSATPEPETLLPLDHNGKFPASVFPGGGNGSNAYLRKNVPDTTEANSPSPMLLLSNLGDGNGLIGQSTNGAGIIGRSDSKSGVVGWTGASDRSGVFGHSIDGHGVTGRSINGLALGATTDNGDFFHCYDASGVKFIVNNAGDVGIGTDSPDAKLTVAGMIHATSGGVQFPDGTVQVSAAAGGGTGGGWNRDATNGEVELTNQTDKVGIGTDSPQQKLHVAGLARFGVRPDAYIDMSTPGGWPGFIALTPGDHRRDIVFDDPDPSSGYKGGMRLLTSKTNGAPDAQNGVTINEDGQVGISTSFPNAELHVNGGFQIGLNSKRISMFTHGAGEDITSTNTLHLNFDNDQAVSIGQGGTSNLYVSGNVGIGTFSPDGKLDIDFGNTGSTHAGTPGGSGPGWIFYAPNGHRRDILADNGGIGIGTSPTSGSAFVDLFVNEDGNVGIRTTNPTNILTVGQNSPTDPIADAWTTYSSRRWKTNIKTIEKPIEIVQRLRGVTYDWKKDGKHDIGLIAEEVGEVLPEVVAYEDNGEDAKSVDYARLVSVLIEAVKEQQREIDELKRTVEAMRSGKTAVR